MIGAVLVFALVFGYLDKANEPRCERGPLLAAEIRWCAEHGRVPEVRR